MSDFLAEPLNCPFCDGIAQAGESIQLPVHVVRCTQCPAEIMHPDPEKARALWNSRAGEREMLTAIKAFVALADEYNGLPFDRVAIRKTKGHAIGFRALIAKAEGRAP